MANDFFTTAGRLFDGAQVEIGGLPIEGAGSVLAASASGLMTTAGSALMAQNLSASATGTVVTSGSGLLSGIAALSATGVVVTSGSGLLSIHAALGATGITATSGSADIRQICAVSATGLVGTSGSATFYIVFPPPEVKRPYVALVLDLELPEIEISFNQAVHEMEDEFVITGTSTKAIEWAAAILYDPVYFLAEVGMVVDVDTFSITIPTAELAPGPLRLKVMVSDDTGHVAEAVANLHVYREQIGYTAYLTHQSAYSARLERSRVPEFA